MDPEALDAARADLLAWGFLEATPGGPRWSRRFRGAVMREAARLAEAERAGRAPPGHPLAVAVQAAWAATGPPAGAAADALHERLLLAVGLAGLPPALRGAWGEPPAGPTGR